MNTVQRTGQWLWIAIVALLAWSIAAGSLLAEPPQPPGSQAVSKSYAIPYFLVILGCTLGLLIVCRSANRTSEVKREDDD